MYVAAGIESTVRAIGSRKISVPRPHSQLVRVLLYITGNRRTVDPSQEGSSNRVVRNADTEQREEAAVRVSSLHHERI